MKAATGKTLMEDGKWGTFQSTPPVKAATFADWTDRFLYCISIHAAREGGDFHVAAQQLVHVISIHAAREGGDAVVTAALTAHRISIHAAREGGDHDDDDHRRKTAISIHAAREGGDLHDPGYVPRRCTNFNPRRP